MRTLAGFAVVLILSSGSLFAQARGGITAPAGRPAMAAPAPRTGLPPTVAPQTVPPPHIVMPGQISGSRNGFTNRQPPRGGVRNNTYFAYPVYIGGYGYSFYGSPSYLVGDYSTYGGYYDTQYPGYAGQPVQQQQQQPNVIVVYPQMPGVMTQYGPPDMSAQQPEPTIHSQTSEPPAAEGTHILLAFKDHTIYSAIAYWVEGDTLHYFTDANTHNQVSVELIDRDLTAKLNQGSGLQVKLPPGKQ